MSTATSSGRGHPAPGFDSMFETALSKAGLSRSSQARSPAASTMVAAPSVIGAMSCLQRVGEERPVEEFTPRTLRPSSVRALGHGERVQRHLRHLFGGPFSGVQPDARAQAARDTASGQSGATV